MPAQPFGRPAGCSAGIGSVESASGDIVRIAGLGPDDVGGDFEHELTEYARTLVPTLYVLIIERGGKDISGTTMDPNVTGRFWVPGLDDLEKPRVSAIVLLDLTDVSGGNALGMGFADFIPASLANKIDFLKTYINCFTAGPASCPMRNRASKLPSRCAAAAPTNPSGSCASRRCRR